MQQMRKVGGLVKCTLLFFLICVLSFNAVAGDEPAWSIPENLTGWLRFIEGPFLKQNDNGTTVFVWYQVQGISAPSVAVMAKVKSSGGAWSSAENVTGFVPLSSSFSDLQVIVAPDDTVWLTYVAQEGTDFVVQARQRIGTDTWQQQTLSATTKKIRGIDFHLGPEGDIGLIWVGCDAGTDYTKGSCQTLARRRAAESEFWTSIEPLATSTNGLSQPSIRVGPGGMMVATWARFETAPNWRIKGKYCSSPTSLWQSGVSNVSNAVEPYFAEEKWISTPVMGADGTLVIAWFHKSGSNYVIKSATRSAISSSWTPETRLSLEYPPVGMETPRLAVGQDGTVTAAWTREDNATAKKSVFTNVRDPGGIWSPMETQLSGWADYAAIDDLVVLPDGRSTLIWTERDSSISPKNEAVYWGHRPKSSGWYSGRVSSWSDSINGAALAGIYSDEILIVWAEEDSMLPPNEKYSILTTGCSFSTHLCNSPQVLAEKYKIAALFYGSVYFSQFTPLASVGWVGGRNVTDPLIKTEYALFFSQWPKPFSWSLFMPVITGSGR